MGSFFIDWPKPLKLIVRVYITSYIYIESMMLLLLHDLTGITTPDYHWMYEELNKDDKYVFL